MPSSGSSSDDDVPEDIPSKLSSTPYEGAHPHAPQSCQFRHDSTQQDRLSNTHDCARLDSVRRNSVLHSNGHVNLASTVQLSTAADVPPLRTSFRSDFVGSFTPESTTKAFTTKSRGMSVTLRHEQNSQDWGASSFAKDSPIATCSEVLVPRKLFVEEVTVDPPTRASPELTASVHAATREAIVRAANPRPITPVTKGLPVQFHMDVATSCTRPEFPSGSGYSVPQGDGKEELESASNEEGLSMGEISQQPVLTQAALAIWTRFAPDVSEEARIRMEGALDMQVWFHKCLLLDSSLAPTTRSLTSVMYKLDSTHNLL